jgi:hypothetical protein
MSITYTYTVISTDQAARCMEVVYESTGRQTMHICARLPYEGETLEQVVQMYAPVAHWETVARNVIAPDVGTTGVVNAAAAPGPDPEQLANAQMWEQLAFEKRVAAALVKFGVLTSNPTEVPVAQL